ncbi:glycosyltransferase [Actimicrobium sp. CCC2.4]|uniref:MGDG synthase family glycosyltransferase n=1 Tax=Actimicrobium sp. CCC2.4 TaxID=3048606 RepID=UPI002AC94AE4|nr:glycosyltransferase [Actimicrobium sp. CCC2.4]MEB0136881.1 glycosyltransferase [Actimicrobium sp. CCC2.4]WPX33431.1 glycosyltransferase [Actimicrobium sp. CCC2.4]
MVVPKRILLLSVSAGSGHLRAADALRAQAALGDVAVSACHLDVMQFVSTAFRKVYTDFYITLVDRHPALWGYVYRLTNDAPPDGSLQKFRRAIERLSTRSLRRAIDDWQPDAIICTHFLPAELLARMRRKGSLACPVWVQVTDFDLHRMWVHDDITGYFAATAEVAFRMTALGVDPAGIHVTGIPVMPAFRAPGSRADCAARLGLDPQRRTILLMGGGAGLGKLDAVAERLLALPHDFQLIVMAGKNLPALQGLQALALRYPDRLLAQGYTDRVEQLMACADLVITKPGGLTTSECLAMGLPMIINTPIPGQEERNADFLLEQGVALKAIDAVTLDYRIGLLMTHPEKLADMAAKARALGHPDAARAVLHTVLEHCP